MKLRRLSRGGIIALSAVTLVIAMASPGFAPPGDLDTTFDGDGRVTTDFGGGTEQAFGVAIQGDGKIVAAGRADLPATGSDFALARYNSDGSLDTTFDGDGKVATDFAQSGEQAQGIAIQGDGKIVLAGTTILTGIYEFALARYNSDGSLDTTFDGDGKLSTDFPSEGQQAWAVAIQSDGKILVAGTAAFSHIEDFALARYNSDGSLDTTFDGDGRVTTDFVGRSDQAFAVAVQGDGKIVAAGHTYRNEARTSDVALARYNANGSLDTTFDGDGKVTTDFASHYDEALGIAIQQDGMIVIAGRASIPHSFGYRTNFGLARYRIDGALDQTFDGDGKVTTQVDGSSDARAVAIQSDGMILAAGIAFGNTQDFGLARYRTDGSLDGIFGGGDGKITTDFGDSWDEAHAIAIDSIGRIVAAGCVECAFSNADDFALARYTVCRVTSRRSSIPCR